MLICDIKVILKHFGKDKGRKLSVVIASQVVNVTFILPLREWMISFRNFPENGSSNHHVLFQRPSGYIDRLIGSKIDLY